MFRKETNVNHYDKEKSQLCAGARDTGHKCECWSSSWASHPSAKADLFGMTDSQVDVFRRGSGLHGIRKPFGSRHSLLAYTLEEGPTGRVGEKSWAVTGELLQAYWEEGEEIEAEISE